MAVKNLHREYSGVKEATSEAINHHECSQVATERKERHLQEMMKYIEDKGSPFTETCPKQLHNFVTKEVISEDTKNDLLQSQLRGIETFQEFHSMRFVEKRTSLKDTIQRKNLKTTAKSKKREQRQSDRLKE